ncbi:radical SAM protein [Thiovibrio sp. JS02]
MHPAADENRVLTIPLADGHRVEAVYYGRATLCLSVQVGCAMGCPFCASGAKGLFRNLDRAELEQQIVAARDEGLHPTRLTLSGIGEPFANPMVPEFIRTQRQQGMPVSLTTTGQPLARLAEFCRLPHNGLMFSLHAGRQETRERLVPRGPSLAALRTALAGLWPTLSRNKRRRFGFNYLILAGINDSGEELAGLREFLRPFPEATLHLLELNAVKNSPFASPGPDQIRSVHHFFQEMGINVRRANRWRRRKNGGCGTLVLDSWSNKIQPDSDSLSITVRRSSEGRKNPLFR